MGDVVKMETPLARAIQIGDTHAKNYFELRDVAREVIKLMKKNRYAQAEKRLRDAINTRKRRVA